MTSLTDRLREHAQLHDNLRSGDPDQEQWADDLRTAAHAIDRLLWKSIDSAPHDRQVLLHKANGDMHVGRWVQNPCTNDEAFAIAELGEHGRAIVHPTHWAELPLPPNV